MVEVTEKYGLERKKNGNLLTFIIKYKHMKSQQLIVNESYWSFFKDQNFRSQEFLVEELNEKESIVNLTKNIAIFMKLHDNDSNVIYGIEIKTNGSERSSRIPLVRFTTNNQSIFKVVKTLQDVDKALIDLQDLIYYLQNTKSGQYSLPKKVLITTFDEENYIDDPAMKEYIKRKIEESGVIWLSLFFLRSIFSVVDKSDLNKLFLKEGAIFTAKAI